jgi:hypothetical protein
LRVFDLQSVTRFVCWPGPAVDFVVTEPTAGGAFLCWKAGWLDGQRAGPAHVRSYVNELRQGVGGGRGPAGLPGIDRGELICPQAAI